MLEVKNLFVSYDGTTLALDNVSIRLPGHTAAGIIGPNGAGKSTLLKAMLGLISCEGSCYIDGAVLTNHLDRVAYVEQKCQIDPHFPITVRECVLLGTYRKLGLFRRAGRSEWEQVAQALEKVGLQEYACRPIHSLSGGQFQRMLIARCLVQEADYIFLDEPFAGIDSASEKIIVDVLKGLRDRGKTLLIVHHDLSKVENYFDRLLILNRRLVAQGAVSEVFTSRRLQQAYGDNIFLAGGKNRVVV